MSEKVYGELTQEELDAEYNNRARVPENGDIMAEFAKIGDAYLTDGKSIRDISFGPSADEVLDIYPAADGNPNAPVLIYFHGGYWYSRHKDDFPFIGAAFAPLGATVVVVNYALIPNVNLAELVRQCRAAVAWTYQNIAEHGGDPQKLFLTGHSAGGHLTAMMFATNWPDWGVPTTSIKGGVAISGLHDLEPIRLNYMNPTLGFTEETVRNYSPARLSPTVNAPIVFGVGGAESSEFVRQNTLALEPWGQAGIPCEKIVADGLNHFTILGDFTQPGGQLYTRTIELMGLSSRAAIE